MVKRLANAGLKLHFIVGSYENKKYLLPVAVTAALLIFSTACTSKKIEKTVGSADGSLISYETQGQGDTALVFVHCWACNQDYWRNQLGPFSKDFRVVTLDMAGHGRSKDFTTQGLRPPHGKFRGHGSEGADEEAQVPIRCVNAAPYRPDGFKTSVATNRKYADFDAVEMTGVGHFPMLERPEEFSAKLRDAVRSILTAKPSKSAPPN